MGNKECEKYQISLIEEITGVKVDKTNKRINFITNKLEDVKKKMNILEWTENFDGFQLNNGKTIYHNLKMICGSEGGQIRALTEVYHFISSQQRHINQEPSSKLFFVNILDGNECDKKIKLFPEVEHEQIFVGSLFEWNENMKGKKRSALIIKSQSFIVSILHLLVWEGRG